MFEFQQIFLKPLAQASYFIASDGEAAVVDPQRDVDEYIREAERCGARIAYVVETHLHADFVSGHRELAARTGAEIVIGASARATFPHRPVRDGDALTFGKCRLGFIETPGHTLDSICVTVADCERSTDPFAVLTGDTLFVGDVGRPDLGEGRTPAELASMLYESLHEKLLKLPEHVDVYPAHGAGSLCGRAMRPERKSTIGEELRTNPAILARNREDFVRLVAGNLPERPAYFAQDVAMNRNGATPMAALPPMRALDAEALQQLQADGAIVLDTRDEIAFGSGHVPRSFNIGLDGSFESWTATLVGLDTDIAIVGSDDDAAQEARMRLARVGIERVRGFLAGGIEAWRSSGLPAATIAQVTVDELNDALSRSGPPQLLDVRRPAEHADGFIPGSTNVPLDRLAGSLPAFDRVARTAVYCASGYRSSVAASILRRSGFADVSNVTDGFNAWRERGLPCVNEAECATV